MRIERGSIRIITLLVHCTVKRLYVIQTDLHTQLFQFFLPFLQLSGQIRILFRISLFVRHIHRFSLCGIVQNLPVLIVVDGLSIGILVFFSVGIVSNLTVFRIVDRLAGGSIVINHISEIVRLIFIIEFCKQNLSETIVVLFKILFLDVITNQRTVLSVKVGLQQRHPVFIRIRLAKRIITHAVRCEQFVECRLGAVRIQIQVHIQIFINGTVILIRQLQSVFIKQNQCGKIHTKGIQHTVLTALPPTDGAALRDRTVPKRGAAHVIFLPCQFRLHPGQEEFVKPNGNLVLSVT